MTSVRPRSAQTPTVAILLAQPSISAQGIACTPWRSCGEFAEGNSAEIEDALKSLRDLLWSIDEHYRIPPSLSIPDPWGAQSLIGYLESAVRADDAERQHWLDLAKAIDARQRRINKPDYVAASSGPNGPTGAALEDKTGY